MTYILYFQNYEFEELYYPDIVNLQNYLRARHTSPIITSMTYYITLISF